MTFDKEVSILKPIKCVLSFSLLLLIIRSPAFSQEIIDSVKQGDIRSVKDLLEENPEWVHQQDRVHYKPLHWAAMLRNRKMAELLISYGADIDDRSNNQHLTPIQCGLMFRYGDDPAVLDFLVDRGANIGREGNEGIRNLRIASAAGYERLVRLLICGGVDVNGRNRYGLTALHVASWTGYSHIAAYLLENGAEVDAESIDGRRPITIAREWKREGIIDLLISHGADDSPQRFPRLRGRYL
jgi:ankyrin repeat protein